MLYFDLASNKVYINSYWTMAGEGTPEADRFNFFDATTTQQAYGSGSDLTTLQGNNDVVAILDTFTSPYGRYFNAMTFALNLDGTFTSQNISDTTVKAYVCKNEKFGTTKFDSATSATALTLTTLESETDSYWFAEITDKNTGGK